MKYCLSQIALGAAVADGYAPMYVRGVPVAKPQARAAATDNEFTCPSGKFGAMCADCSTMLVISHYCTIKILHKDFCATSFLIIIVAFIEYDNPKLH